MLFSIFSTRRGGGGITSLFVLSNLLFSGAVLCLAGCPVYVDKTVQVPVEQQDGSSWETAFSTIQAGVDEAVNKSIGSYAVWVRGESDAISGGNPYCDGIYNEIITIDPTRDFWIFGGFNGTEEPYYTEEGGAELVAKDRSWILNPTYIDGTNITSGAMNLVTMTGNVHIDGFTICNGELLGGPIRFTSGNVESIISNSIIEDNYALWSVGGITVSDGTVKIINCLFRYNVGGPGGVLALYGSGIADVINCTIEDNSASGSIISDASSAASITNSILWDNIAYQQLINGSPTITYSCVQGGYAGTGNINQDPVFVDAIPALSYGSPCMDTGTFTEAPDHDIMKNPRPIGYGVDMGAYEGVYSADLEGVIAINEVLAENETTNQDEDEDYSPWLELHNRSLSNVNLQGWTLTDEVTYWTFPNITLAAGEYKLVFLSGKNRTGAELHTNFTLSSQGGTILLQDDQTPPVSYMYFDYPADMLTDVSYGFNETVNVNPEDKEFIPIISLRPPTPESRNDTYFGHALAAWTCYDPDAVEDNLPYLTGYWPWRDGYKVTKTQPNAQYIIDNVHKFDIFYINSHGAAVENDCGWFWLTDRTMRNTEIASYIPDSHKYKFVHINVCRSGLIGEEWLQAFNAITFLGWDWDIYNNHCEWFDFYFYHDYIRYSQQTITNATANAYLRVEDLHPDIIAQYGMDTVPFPVVTGNFDLRLDIPDSMHNPA